MFESNFSYYSGDYSSIRCAPKSSSIFMTDGDDNGEGAFVKQPYVLHSIKFQNRNVFVWVCICGSCSEELSVDLYILHEGVQLTIRGSGKHKQTITKLPALPGGIKTYTFRNSGSDTVQTKLSRRSPQD